MVSTKRFVAYGGVISENSTSLYSIETLIVKETFRYFVGIHVKYLSGGIPSEQVEINKTTLKMRTQFLLTKKMFVFQRDFLIDAFPTFICGSSEINNSVSCCVHFRLKRDSPAGLTLRSQTTRNLLEGNIVNRIRSRSFVKCWYPVIAVKLESDGEKSSCFFVSQLNFRFSKKKYSTTEKQHNFFN